MVYRTKNHTRGFTNNKLVAAAEQKMNCKVLAIYCMACVLVLRGADSQVFPCYGTGGLDVNLSLEDTIHLSDVVLLGRIVAVKEGEFGTHTAVVSYYYSYKNDGLLPKRLFWSTSVKNFSPAPKVGQLGMFFLFREPSMQLALFCTTPIRTLLETAEGGFQEIVNYINQVGSSK